MITKLDKLNDGRKKINHAIEVAKSSEQTSHWARETANESKRIADNSDQLAHSVQTQLNEIVVDGDSSVEAAQARIDSEGNQFGTLKERLDTGDKKVNAVDLKPYLDRHNQNLFSAMQDWTNEQTMNNIQNRAVIYLPADATIRLTGIVNIPNNVTLSIPKSTTILATGVQGCLRLIGESRLIGEGVIDFAFLNDVVGIQARPGSNADIIGIEIKNSKSDAVHYMEGSTGLINKIRLHSINAESNVDQIGIRVLTNKRVVILGNTLHDIKGNAIYIDGQALSDKTMEADIQWNVIYDVTNHWGTGQYGNGIHGWVAHNIIIKHNTVIRCSFSNVRLAACEDSEVASNTLENPVSVDDGSGVFIEFTTKNILVNDNILTNANIMMRNQEDSNAEYTICSRNVLKGGWMSTEGSTIISDNIIEIGENDHPIGILLGWGRTCYNIVCQGNIIKDSKSTPTLIAGVAVLAQWNAGSTSNWRNVKIGNNTVQGAEVSISGHRDGNPTSPDGKLEPMPDFVEVTGNNDGHSIDQYASFSRSGQTQVDVVVGILPKFGERQYFFSSAPDRRMVKVTVEGSRWNEGTYYRREYVASTFQSGNAVQRKNAFGTTGNETLLVYEDADSYYFIMRLTGFWNVSIKSEFIGAYGTTIGGGHEKFYVSGLTHYGLNLSQLTNVTSAFPITEVS